MYNTFNQPETAETTLCTKALRSAVVATVCAGVALLFTMGDPAQGLWVSTTPSITVPSLRTSGAPVALKTALRKPTSHQVSQPLLEESVNMDIGAGSLGQQGTTSALGFLSSVLAGTLLTAFAVAAASLRRSPQSPLQPLAMFAATGAPKKRVVVTGMGVASVFGNDVDEYYNALLEGRSGVRLIDRFDTSGFPTRFAGQIADFSSEGLIPAKTDKRLDDTIRYSIVASKKALIQAGIEKGANPEAHEKLNKAKVGVLVASGMGGLGTLETGVKALESRGVKAMSPFVIPYAIANMGGSLVAIEQGFMGPNYSIATACASANYAFTAAADHIRSGRADVMLAGGSEASIVPVGLGGFVACRALSKNNDDPQGASRPWDKARDGFVMGEGAGVLVLESLEHAQARGATILAEFLGGAITCDAYHMTSPRDDGLGVASCMEMAMEDAGIERDQVNYINAHATSTEQGDIAEVNAIKKVFSNMSHMKMNATKSLIGHCLGAAGGMEAVATIKAIMTGYVHPTLNLKDPIDEVAGINCVPDAKQAHDITAGMSNSFGFGGHNSVCIFGPYKP